MGGGSGDVKAPMPGLVVAVQVEEGQTVTQGETVIVLEAMKMQNELKSPIDGEIESVSVEVSQTVDKGDLLVAHQTSRVNKQPHAFKSMPDSPELSGIFC